MQSRAARAGVLAVIVAAAVVLFIVLQDNNGSNGGAATSGLTVKQITIKNGQPVGGVQKLTVKKGGRIRFEVHSDVSDEVHLHGYDIHKNVNAGGTVTFDVPATLEGEFEAELEARHTQILALTVVP
jgi:hypothetical protein